MNVFDITVPSWGLEMEEATVVRWLKQVGDTVQEDEPILVMETDKAEGCVEAEATGRLLQIVASPGDILKPGDLLGRIEISG